MKKVITKLDTHLIVKQILMVDENYLALWDLPRKKIKALRNPHREKINN